MRFAVAWLCVTAACGFRSQTPFAGDDEPQPIDAVLPEGMALPDGAMPDGPPPDAFTPMFSYGCENGVPGMFSGIHLSGAAMSNGDFVSQTSAVSHSGTSSCRCNTNLTPMNQATPFVTFSDRDTVYVGLWVRLGTPFPTTTWVRLISVADPSPSWINMATAEIYPDRRIGVDSETDVGSTIHYSTATLTTGTWHHVELRIVVGANGRMALWIDGALQFDIPKDMGTRLFNLVHTGISWQENHSTPAELFIDDVAVD